VTKHPFDPVALVFGLVFAAAGVIVMTGGRLIDEGRVLAPLGLVALGVGLLLRPARPTPTPPAPTAPLGYADAAATDPGTHVAPLPDWPTDRTTPDPDRPAPTDAIGSSASTPPATHQTRATHTDDPGPSVRDETGVGWVEQAGPGADDPTGDLDHEPGRQADDSGPPGGPSDAATTGGTRPDAPGAEFYLGTGWRAPSEEPDDGKPEP